MNNSNLIIRGRCIIHRDIDSRPVLFLDCDGVIAAENGGPLDGPTVLEVADTVRLADACVVLCTDRARNDVFFDQLHAAGLPRHALRGQCDPEHRGVPSVSGSHGMSSKVARVVEWLTVAEEHYVSPSAWCVLDDARTFSHDWRTATQHVIPSGPLATRLDLARVWSLLTRKMPHYIRRAAAAEADRKPKG